MTLRAGRLAIEALLWTLAASGAGVAVHAARAVSKPLFAAAAVAIPPQRYGHAGSGRGSSALDAADRITAHDPFRFTHLPSVTSYSPEMGGAPGAVPAHPAAVRPQLAVRGIVGRRGDWRAILLGVPGVPAGVVVASGDTLGGLHVRGITHDSVIVRGPDTTWTLVVRAGWQP